MAIKINDIPPQGTTIEIEDTLDLFGEAAKGHAPFRATVTINPGPHGTFHVTGKVNAEVSLECSRCLKPFPFFVKDAGMDFELLPKMASATAAEHELGRSELDSEFYTGDEIEPKELVREQVLLVLPMVPIHSEECRGLCPVCGTDWNERTCSCRTEGHAGEESPFAVLKKIIKPEKE